jgi:predicted sulfurtransferase
MPVAATAAVAVMMFAVILANVIDSPDAAGTQQQTAGTVAERADSVNVQVTVSTDQTDQLLQWLNDQKSVETVTIQLPDTAQFQLRGEPVFLRPELPGERVPDSATDDSFGIIPLEDPEG